MTDITHCKKVYVSTSKSADYVSAVDHDGAVEFVMADSVQALVDALRVAIDALHTIDDRHYTAVKMFNNATQWDEETYHDGRCLNDFVFGDAHSAEATARAALKQWENQE